MSAAPETADAWTLVVTEIRAQPRGAPQRCPYCHDHLADERVELIVTCPGCDTQHHAVCLAELGRCTIMGCEQPVEAPALPADLHLTAIARAIRKRARDRAQGFVRRNVAPPRDLEQLKRRQELEAEIGQWLPEFLEVALRNPDPYDPDQITAIRKIAVRRGLLPTDFGGLIRGWSNEALRQGLAEDRERFTIAQRHTLSREMRRRGLRLPRF